MSLPTKEFAMSIRLAALSAVLVSLAFTAAPGCVADEPEADPLLLASASQSATVVQNLNTAEATFKTAVNQSMATSATAAGVTLSSSGVQMARVPRDRTLATSATTAGKLALLLSRPVARSSGRYDAGFYELSKNTAGPVVHFYHPTLGKISIAPPPPPGTAEFHTPLGDDLCEGAPGLLQDYCQQLVSCWAYELYCN
jgi:hypothetical protein